MTKQTANGSKTKTIIIVNHLTIVSTFLLNNWETNFKVPISVDLDSSIFRSSMKTTNPTKSDNGVVITSTPKGDNGFDDKMWADLLK